MKTKSRTERLMNFFLVPEGPTSFRKTFLTIRLCFFIGRISLIGYFMYTAWQEHVLNSGFGNDSFTKLIMLMFLGISLLLFSISRTIKALSISLCILLGKGKEIDKWLEIQKSH